MDEEIVGEDGPVQPKAAEIMSAILSALNDMVGDQFWVVLFLGEKKSEVEGELPRFNYGSTANRGDMIRILEAFIQKQKNNVG